MTTLLKDLIDIPLQVSSGDFVLNLADGVQHPKETMDNYVVTPQLLGCFEEALLMIQSSLEGGKSKAAYLHGSFGSGKSHFMAVLHLLLNHDPEARRRTEFSPILARHPWVQGRKFLLVPFHMVAQPSMEAAILGGYVNFVRRLHPESSIPGVFLSEKLFENAADFRRRLGDAPFFSALNEGASASPYGKLAPHWDAVRYDTAVFADPKDPAREKLVGALVTKLFPAFADMARTTGGGYISLDEGLAVIGRHAQTLGYDALILFLDELILWLAAHAADLKFLETEGQKLSKLVEAESTPPIPIISFVARQRDLRELVGKNLTGADQLNFSDILKHWEGRFKTISLEDRNLPEIAEKRILRPRNESARVEIDEAFERLSRMRDTVMSVLLTSRGDKGMFRKVYPFTPALVEALVAISSALQRERTALKIMVELLVGRRDSLALGQLIPVGDLFDVIGAGDQAFSDLMKGAFEHARKLYRHKLVPMLEAQHEVSYDMTEEERAADPAAAQRWNALQTHARILKTLILAAMVPEVEALKNLTGQKLAALNFGTIKSPIPNGEGKTVMAAVSGWAAQVGEIKLSGDGDNRFVSIQLTGIDTETILSQAQGEDNTGNRRQLLKKMLFDMLKLPETDNSYVDTRVVWRGTGYAYRVVLARLFDTTDDSLQTPANVWRIWLDYPFGDRGPNDAVARLEQYKGPSTNAVAWIPSFFSAQTNQDLGKLVVLTHVLNERRFPQYVTHLAMQEREQARVLLQNQRDALTTRLRQAILAAYGLSDTTLPLDDAHQMTGVDHFYALTRQLTPRVPAAAELHLALQQLVSQGLESEYPGHPDLGEQEVRLREVQKLWQLLDAALDDPAGTLIVEKADRGLVLQVAVPLHLVRMGENKLEVQPYWVDLFHRKLAETGVRTPTVRELYRWMDEPKAMGLPEPLRDLVVLTYARQTQRSFVLYGQAKVGDIDLLEEEMQVPEQTLPDESVWSQATQRAAELLGKPVPRGRSAANTDELLGMLETWAKQHADNAATVAKGLRDLDPVAATSTLPCLRCASAHRLHTLTQTLQGKDKGLRLERFVSDTTDVDLPRVRTAAAALGEQRAILGHQEQEQVKLLVSLAEAKYSEPQASLSELQDARASLQELREVLCSDELTIALAPVLSSATRAATRAAEALLRTPPAPPVPPLPPRPPKGWKVLDECHKPDVLTADQTRKVLSHLEGLLSPGVRVTLNWSVSVEE